MISSGELMFYSGEHFFTNNINHYNCKMDKNANDIIRDISDS